MKIDITKKIIGDKKIQREDMESLEKAIQQSESDSMNSKLPGIINLIQVVEELQDKYGVAHDHHHLTEDIVEAMCANKELVARYGLENLAKRLEAQHIDYHSRKIQTREAQA
jgi:uncharacterized protein (DUF927 family)